MWSTGFTCPSKIRENDDHVTRDNHLFPPAESDSQLFDPIPNVNPENFYLRTKAGEHRVLFYPCHSRSQRNDITDGSSNSRTHNHDGEQTLGQDPAHHPSVHWHTTAHTTQEMALGLLFSWWRRVPLGGIGQKIRGYVHGQNPTIITRSCSESHNWYGNASSSGIHKTPTSTKIWPKLIASTSTRQKTQRGKYKTTKQVWLSFFSQTHNPTNSLSQ